MTTVSQVLKNAPQPVLPRFVHPGNFQPLKDHPLHFLNNFEKACILNAWSDVERIFFFGGFLEGNAFTWYREFRANPLNSGKNWDNILAEFKEEFLEDCYTHNLTLQLRAKKQGDTQDILEYFYEILDLCNLLDVNMEFSTFREHFELGLNAKYQYDATMQTEKDMNFKQFKKAISKLSNAKKREKSAIEKEKNSNKP